MMAIHSADQKVQMTVSAQEFKDAMSNVAATVTIVTASTADGLVGLTATAFMSVSADPAIVLVCIDKRTGSLEPMLEAEGFTVNIMPEGTEDEAMLFATHGADKFGGSEWRYASIEQAGPVLTHALEHLECVTCSRSEMGDHWVIYGKVEAVGVADASAVPLIWRGRGFVKLA